MVKWFTNVVIYINFCAPFAQEYMYLKLKRKNHNNISQIVLHYILVGFVGFVQEVILTLTGFFSKYLLSQNFN